MSGLLRLGSVRKLIGQLSSCPKSKNGLNILNLCRTVATTYTKRSESNTKDVSQTQSKPKKYWVSYGFSNEDPKLDKELMHLTLFVAISIFLTFGSFILIYMPDMRLDDWALREAYLQLRHRESLGLPPIDPNLIDPAKVILPTDEELGNREIII